MQKFLAMLVTFFAFIHPVNAKTILDKQQYFSSLRTSCNIKVNSDKGFTGTRVTEIYVVCGNGKSGNCAGHELDDYFSCRTNRGGNNNGLSKGVTTSVNWILNNL